MRIKNVVIIPISQKIPTDSVAGINEHRSENGIVLGGLTTHESPRYMRQLAGSG